jgi:hypothetical protein
MSRPMKLFAIGSASRSLVVPGEGRYDDLPAWPRHLRRA